MMIEINKKLATFVVYWPSQPVYCCERHKNMLIEIGNALGFIPHYQQITETTFGDCINCINESKKSETLTPTTMPKDRVIIKVVIDESKHPVFKYHFMIDKELPEMVEWSPDQIDQMTNNLNKFLTRELLSIKKP